jgi:membrane protease YdiL (CAAX protease family)
MVSEKPWRPDAVARTFALLFVSIGGGMLFSVWLSQLTGANASTIPQFSNLVIGTVFFHGIAVLLLHALLREHAVDWSQAFGFKWAHWKKTLGLGIAGGLLALPMAWVLTAGSASLMERVQMKPVAQQAVQLLQTSPTMSWGQKIGFGFIAILLAPAVEEMLFRGILYPSLKQAGYPRLAWWVTSLFFASIHCNAMTFVPLTLLAILLTWLYEQADNLLAPMVAHGLFNGVNFLGVVFSYAPFQTGR